MILFQFLRETHPGLKTTAGTLKTTSRRKKESGISLKDKFAISFLPFVRPHLWWEFDDLFEKGKQTVSVVYS